MIYFAQAGEHVKIGRTKDADTLKRRLTTLQTGQPRRLAVIRTIDAPIWAEGWLHGFFAGARAAGEWFSYREEMLTIVLPTEKPPGGWANARVTKSTRNLTMRLPLDLVAHAEMLAAGKSLKPVIVAGLRSAWNLPEPVRGASEPSNKQPDKAA